MWGLHMYTYEKCEGYEWIEKKKFKYMPSVASDFNLTAHFVTHTLYTHIENGTE